MDSPMAILNMGMTLQSNSEALQSASKHKRNNIFKLKMAQAASH